MGCDYNEVERDKDERSGSLPRKTMPASDLCCAAGNLVACLAMVAAVSYAGIFSNPGNNAAVGIAVMKTSLPFGKARGLVRYPVMVAEQAIWFHSDT